MNDFKYEPLSLERIQAEQDKHKLGLIALGIPQVDLSDKSIEDCDSITMAIQDIAKRATEEQELYIICEMAKLYVESQRPAKWLEWVDEKWGGSWFYCSKCHNDALYKNVDGIFTQVLSNHCPNCDAKMEEHTK